uniref:Uncharacterized protein n=2 Tax=unclassified Caudoviricetes TaxID=2788787 RepID=A0A8S5VB07_9CAUD|nr:MAG TPA: hypothetical protein [Siphoviridae sp. ctfrT39]DAG03945.1 MAG TPA: hypothetical protein [Siphoviridae sp. ct0vA12]
MQRYRGQNGGSFQLALSNKVIKAAFIAGAKYHQELINIYYRTSEILRL